MRAGETVTARRADLDAVLLGEPPRREDATDLGRSKAQRRWAFRHRMNRERLRGLDTIARHTAGEGPHHRALLLVDLADSWDRLGRTRPRAFVSGTRRAPGTTESYQVGGVECAEGGAGKRSPLDSSALGRDRCRYTMPRLRSSMALTATRSTASMIITHSDSVGMVFGGFGVGGVGAAVTTTETSFRMLSTSS